MTRLAWLEKLAIVSKSGDTEQQDEEEVDVGGPERQSVQQNAEETAENEPETEVEPGPSTSTAKKRRAAPQSEFYNFR